MLVGINDVLIRVPHIFPDKITVNGVDMLLSSVWEDAHNAFKVAEITSAPLNNPHGIRKGDMLIFSHLILNARYGDKMKEIASEYLIDDIDSIYRVPPGLSYGYLRDGEIFMIEPYVMVKPIPEEEKITAGGIILPAFDREVLNVGILYKKNAATDYEEGDVVIFEKNSEYEVKVGGDRMYRMQNDWLLAKYEV